MVEKLANGDGTGNGDGVTGTNGSAGTANGTAPSAANGIRRRKAKSTGLAALIGEAESLKSALRDAFSRSHKLLVAIKRQRAQSKIVQSFLKALRELQSVDG